jgi:hypothetical protein
LDRADWPVESVWSGYDPFLCRAWGRQRYESLYLYRLEGSRGRAAWLSPRDHNSPPTVSEHSPNRVVMESQSDTAGTVVLTELFYPGWEVTVDGEPEESLKIEGMYRGAIVPAGNHTIEWRYRPKSQWWGYWISGGAILLVVLVMLIRRFSHRSSSQPKASTKAKANA